MEINIKQSETSEHKTTTSEEIMSSTSVFVAGAAGYIGEGVALAFRRAGFRVYGLVRNPSKAETLSRNEVTPVIANLEDVEAYKHILDKCAVVVDAVGLGDFSKQFLNAVNESGKRRNNNGEWSAYKPLFIFTSGIMTYGNAGNGPLDETIEPRPSHQWTVDRKDFEHYVLEFGKREESWIRPVVVRPGFVYGRSGGPINTQFFSVPKDQNLKLLGSPNKRWSWVHVDDLGEGYVQIAKAGSVVDNQLFNLATADSPTFYELRVTMAKASGWDDTKYSVEYGSIPSDDIGTQVWEDTVIINPEKSFTLINWKPKHLSNFLSDIDIYYQTWLSYQSSK